jgi:hypothetical protein
MTHSGVPPQQSRQQQSIKATADLSKGELIWIKK